MLRPELVAAYSRPSAVTLCPVKTTSCTGKPLGSRFTARRHEGDWSFVESKSGDKGWVHLQQLGIEPNETVEFVGGLFSYFRGDMAQAQALFEKAADTAAADSIVRQDAKVLRAIARSRLGAMATGDFDHVIADDPYSRYALQAAVMDALQRYSRDHNGSIACSALPRTSATAATFSPATIHGSRRQRLSLACSTFERPAAHSCGSNRSNVGRSMGLHACRGIIQSSCSSRAH